MGGLNFWEITSGVRSKLAFVGRGPLRNISPCDVRFLTPQPPPDDYCTVSYSIKCYHKIATQLMTDNNLSTYLELFIACPSELITALHNAHSKMPLLVVGRFWPCERSLRFDGTTNHLV